MSKLDNISDPLKYSELQTRLITLLEIMQYLAKERIVVEQTMKELETAPSPLKGGQK